MWVQTPWGYFDWLSAETTCATRGMTSFIQLTLFYRELKKNPHVCTNSYSVEMEGKLTHLLVPAGGWCDGILLWLSCHETTTELCGWLQKKIKKVSLKIHFKIGPYYSNWGKKFEVCCFVCSLVCFHLPEFNEEWWRGLWEPNMFIRWLLFWGRCHIQIKQQGLVHDPVYITVQKENYSIVFTQGKRYLCIQYHTDTLGSDLRKSDTCVVWDIS